MTLDEFLRALEHLIEDREQDVDDPGEGNFSCEDCRACNNCRFCVGCDSCEDCTYCEECIDCTSCTQSKRCVDCQKVSYCEDSRDCKASRYLTLCVQCTDCVHCLACVGLEGGEFFVLNQKRSRKEYFALLRQVQELMGDRMRGGWRPPNIGLASDIVDPITAGRDAELTAAPWLEEDERDEPQHWDDRRPARDEPARGWRDDYDAPSERDARRPLARDDDYGRDVRRPLARDDYDPPSERDVRRPPARDDRAAPYDRDDVVEPRPRPTAREPIPREREPESARDWIQEPPEFGSSYTEREDERTRPRTRDTNRARRPDYGPELGRELDDDWERPAASPVWRDEAQRDEGYYERSRSRESERHGFAEDHDVPHRTEQQPTQPFTRQREYGYEPRPLDDPPAPREREASSPWIDGNDDADAGSDRAKRNSLRRAGRPKRPPSDEPKPSDASGTNSASYRSGTAPSGKTEGTHTGTGTGLRLGRRPKRS